MFYNKNYIIALLLVLISSTLICGQLDVKITADALKDDIPQETTTSTTVKPSISSSSSSTRKTTTTSTTPAPSSTSSTSTTSSTTSTTTSTTAKPTTVAPSTTTAKPPEPTTVKPYPAPQVGVWNSSCILLKMAAQLNFTYITKDNKNATALYNIPADAKVYDSECTNQNTIQLIWGPTDAIHSITLYFAKNKTVSMYMINIVIHLLDTEFPDAKENQTVQLLHRGHEFESPLKMSFHCTRAQHFNMTEVVSNQRVLGVLTVSDVQVEAFRNETKPDDNKFSIAHDCDSSQTSDIVPIAVGIALVALIVIVLIAYLCARRRTATRGYMSF